MKLEFMLALVVVLSACGPLGADAGARQAATYQCVASGEGAAAHKSRRLTVLYDARGQQALVSIEGGSVNYLSLVSDVKERLFANAKYAWKSNGDVNQLTDLADVRVYDCTRSPTAAP